MSGDNSDRRRYMSADERKRLLDSMTSEQLREFVERGRKDGNKRQREARYRLYDRGFKDRPVRWPIALMACLSGLETATKDVVRKLRVDDVGSRLLEVFVALGGGDRLSVSDRDAVNHRTQVAAGEFQRLGRMVLEWTMLGEGGGVVVMDDSVELLSDADRGVVLDFARLIAAGRKSGSVVDGVGALRAAEVALGGGGVSAAGRQTAPAASVAPVRSPAAPAAPVERPVTSAAPVERVSAPVAPVGRPVVPAAGQGAPSAPGAAVERPVAPVAPVERPVTSAASVAPVVQPVAPAAVGTPAVASVRDVKKLSSAEKEAIRLECEEKAKRLGLQAMSRRSFPEVGELPGADTDNCVVTAMGYGADVRELPKDIQDKVYAAVYSKYMTQNNKVSRMMAALDEVDRRIEAGIGVPGVYILYPE